METYLIYIGKVAIAAGAFYIAFLLLFQNQKHFVFNRIYLPVSLALSFVIPLITFTTVKYIEPVSVSNFEGFAYLPDSTAIIAEPQFVFEWFHYLLGFYMLGTAGFLFYLLLGHFKAIKIIQKSSIQKIFESLVNVTNRDVHPFSFFNKIVISEKTLSHPDLEMIVSHENIHVREKHTLDILFAEILFLFQWFNPFAWLIKDAVKNNLEYLTDNEIAKHFNPQTYQMAMLTLADKQGIAPFLNALNGSQLKNRIVMMKKKTESKYSFVKQLVVLPLLAVLVMGLSNREVKTEIVQPEKTNKISWQNQDSYESFDEDFKSQLYQNGLFILKDYGEDAPLIYLNGKEVVEKVILNESDVKWIKVLKGDEAIAQFGNRGKNGAMLFNTETEFEWPNPVKKMLVNIDGKTIPSDNPKLNEYDTSKGFDGGEIIDALEIDGNKVNSTVLDFDAEKVTFYIQTSDYVQGTNPDFEKIIEADKREIETKETFYAVDGEIVSQAFFEKYGEDGFESVVILTGKDASEKYGNNYETVVDAKTGVSKSESLKDTVSKKPPRVVKILKHRDDDLSNALYLVDGVEVDNLEAISPNNIKSIDVLKGKSATELYGEKGKNGVVVVTTKNTKQNNVGFDFGSFKDVAPSGSPLYIVDGIEVEDITDLAPEDIESINVFKDKSATDLYGVKGKNGVICIETKLKKEFNPNDKLIIVDGKVYDGEINDISPNEIASVSVLKEKSATEIYGSKGKNGVIIIETKSEDYKEPLYFLDGKRIGADEANNYRSNSQLVKEILILSEAKARLKYGSAAKNGAVEIYSKKNPTTVDRIFSSNSPKEKPLVFVDGKRFYDINQIDPLFIKSVYVLKDIAAIEKYGDLGKNGVIEVKLKAPEELTQNEIPVVLNGKATGQKFNEINNYLIEQIKKIEPTEAIKKYGDFGKFGVLEVNTKTEYNLDKSNALNTEHGIIPGHNSTNDIIIPQGFSPNGDGVHDFFEVRGLEKLYPNFKMEIFNDNKASIWEYKHNGDPNTEPEWWNGKDNKNKIKKGTYYYVIEFNDGSRKKSTAGTFILAE